MAKAKSDVKDAGEDRERSEVWLSIHAATRIVILGRTHVWRRASEGSIVTQKINGSRTVNLEDLLDSIRQVAEECAEKRRETG
jgi:hypothetical protein